MKIRVLIVDDEPLARQRVRLFLRDEADVEIVGESENGVQAVAQIEATRPDLLFLDVQMPEMDGFEVLQSLPAEILPVVIFTTAYDEHALRAFDAHALDYLLKPYKPERLKEAVHRARDLISNKQAGMAARGLLDLLGERQSSCSHLKRLTVKDEGRVSFIDVGAIHAIEAAGKYAVVHVGQEKHVLREGMNWLEAHLPTEQFFRLSRSVIVNVSQIKELQALFKGENVVILKNGSRFSTTRPLREIQQKLEFP